MTSIQHRTTEDSNQASAEPPTEAAQLTGANTGGIRGFARRRPVTLYLLIVLGIAWPAFVVPILLDFPLDPSKLLVTLVVMIGTATMVTSWREGRVGVRNLFSGVLRWRIGVGRYLLVLAALPALTVLVAWATGTFRAPTGGWPHEVAIYLLNTVVIGALILNLWEETAWSGFVQTRLMARHGLLVGSLLTALPFIGIHLPLAFEGDDVSVGSVALSLGALAGTALVLRYLIGTVLIDTGGSLLAVGLLHASFNNSQALSVLSADAWWQNIVALVVLTGLVTVYRRARGRSIGRSPRAERRPMSAGR
jgi:membrane protease YdiL (CAAX protease family)